MKSKKTLSVLAALLLAVGSASAQFSYDFIAVNDGDTLYYNVIDSAQHHVSVRGASAPDFFTSPGYTSPYNNPLTIPAEVEHEGTIYTVTALADSAFYCHYIRFVLPSTLRSIGAYALAITTGTDITLSDSIESIGTMAFWGMRNVVYHGPATGAPWGAVCLNAMIEDGIYYADSTRTKLVSCDPTVVSPTIAPTVDTIAPSAFRNCSMITSIAVPEGVQYIGSYAFNGCLGLREVDLPSTLTYIAPWAFHYSGAHWNPFSGNTDTCKLTIHDAACDIDSKAFFGSGFDLIDLGTRVRSLGDSCLAQCMSLKSITIPASVENYGTGILSMCQITLQEVELPHNMDTVPAGLLESCDAMRKLTLPAAVQHIGDNAFYGCYTMKLTCQPETPPTVGENCFQGMDVSLPLTVPCGTAVAYAAAEGWDMFLNIVEDCSAIDDPNADNLLVRSIGHDIEVIGADGETVRVFDTMGRECGLRNLAAGIYLVRIGDRPAKRVAVGL